MQVKIIVYTNTICPVCQLVREFLVGMNLPYEEVNLDFHPLERLKLIGRTKRLSVPQTNINEKWVFGFDPVKMLQELEKKTE